MAITEIAPDIQPGARLDVDSDLGRLVLGSLERESPLQDATLTVLGVGTNNVALHAGSWVNGSYQEVICRTPKEPDTGRAIRLIREYGVLQHVPEGVAPTPYYIDTTRRKRPVLVQECVTGHSVPFDKWDEPMTLALAHSLGKMHSETATTKRPVSLGAHLMRFPVGERFRKTPPEDDEARRLCEDVLASTTEYFEKVQYLFDEAPHTLTHNDLLSPNIIITGSGELRIIDFEHAGMSDPALELAEVYHPNESYNVDGSQVCIGLGAEQEAAFLGAYKDAADRDDPTLPERIRIGQFAAVARLVIGHTLLISAKRTEKFDNMSLDTAIAERDHARNLFEIALASI